MYDVRAYEHIIGFHLFISIPNFQAAEKKNKNKIEKYINAQMFNVISCCT